MYAVTITSSTTNTARTSYESTLSAAVSLTLGISANWTICPITDATANCISIEDNTAAYGLGKAYNQGRAKVGLEHWASAEEWKRYDHALRSLVCRWTTAAAKRQLMTTEDRTQYRHNLRLPDYQLSKIVLAADGYITL